MKVSHGHGDPHDLTLLDRNARFMRHETFQALVANIKRDGVLTQWPWVYCDPQSNQKVVYSGNHRVKAAIEAGLTSIDWIETDTPLTADQLLGIQLSHNAISGEDDPTILKELFESIDDVDMRMYAGLDDKTLELLDQVEIGSLGEANLDYQTISLMFLPSEVESARAATEEAMQISNASEFWTAAYGQYEDALNALDDVRGAHKIGNAAVALAIIISVFRNHVTDLADAWMVDDRPAHTGDVPIATLLGYTMPAKAATQVQLALRKAKKNQAIDHRWEALTQWAEGNSQRPPLPNPNQKDWITVADILGTDAIPPDAAAVIAQAIEKMISEDDVASTAQWQAIEHWAADYLASN